MRDVKNTIYVCYVNDRSQGDGAIDLRRDNQMMGVCLDMNIFGMIDDWMIQDQITTVFCQYVSSQYEYMYYRHAG